MNAYQIRVSFIKGEPHHYEVQVHNIPINHDSNMIVGGELVRLIKKALQKSEFFNLHIVDGRQFQSDSGNSSAMLPDRNGMLNLDTLSEACLEREFSVQVEHMPDFEAIEAPSRHSGPRR